MRRIVRLTENDIKNMVKTILNEYSVGMDETFNDDFAENPDVADFINNRPADEFRQQRQEEPQKQKRGFTLRDFINGFGNGTQNPDMVAAMNESLNRKIENSINKIKNR